MEGKVELMTVDNVHNRVYVIRGQQVMLDCDLTEIYGYEVKALNQQVKRNIARFPEDFMFQLEKEEIPNDCLKSQFVTLNEMGNKRGLHIKKMRHYIKQNQQFVTQSEMRLVTAKVSEISVQVASLTDTQKKTEQDVYNIQKRIDENFISDKDFKNLVIYKGQKFEADAVYIDIYQQANTSIYVVDDYVNTKTLQLLSQKKAGVEVILFTENGHGRNRFLTTAVVSDFAGQYPPLRIKSNPDCHDRWIVLDYGLPTEQAYHCGDSSKDAGKKLCAINKIENTAMIHPVMGGVIRGG